MVDVLVDCFVGVGVTGVSVAVVWIVFFFQAEDGIRDLTVTGVQTCALPISLLAAFAGARHFNPAGRAKEQKLTRNVEPQQMQQGASKQTWSKTAVSEAE